MDLHRAATTSRNRSAPRCVGCILVVGLVLAIYVLRLNEAAGLIVDDAWYVLHAQALAAGEGYTLVNALEPGQLPQRPPGFPALLAPVFLVSPFPANVRLLKATAIAAMLGVGWLAWRYYVGRGIAPPVAFGMATALVLTPAFVFLATSTVMSECIFTLASLGAILLIDRADGAGRGFAAGMVAAAAALVRTAGLPLVLAGVVYLAWHRRRAAAGFALAAAIGVGPWFLYAVTQPAPASYASDFWMRWAGDPTSGTVTARDLPGRVSTNLVDVFGRDVGGIVLPELYRPPVESGEETIALGGPRSATAAGSMGSAPGAMGIAVGLSLVALVGFLACIRRAPSAAEVYVPLALIQILLWPHWAFRFVLPLAPFLFVYLVEGTRALTRHGDRVVRIALLIVISLHVADHAQYLRNPEPVWVADAREVDELLTWMCEHVTEPGAVATTNPPLVYLHTGRKTIAIDDAPRRWRDWRARGVRYLVAVWPADLPGPGMPYRVRYRTERRGLWILELT